jgi:hypothetical protein
MNGAPQVEERLERFAERMVPRILSQACRDPNAAAYGAFDRDWWHYKIRDFPSVILQQGGYALWLAGRLDRFAVRRDALDRLAAAACRFWNRRAVRRGAFEEYYPAEEGYPPLAFSTLAVAKLTHERAVEPGAIEAGAAVAARQLLSRFEGRAANQQVAGLAALAWVRRTFPDLAPAERFNAVADRTLALQHEEGWFPEYGGPDLGYLSVTLDCLWDLYDATREDRYRAAAERALRFLSDTVSALGHSFGMHNARNTDYVLPYGIARFAVEPGACAPVARRLIEELYADLDDPGHFLHAVDDRYLCHYTGHSILRAVLALKNGSVVPPAGPAECGERLLAGSGHYLRRSAPSGLSLVISLKKGGVITAARGAQECSDFGWVVQIGQQQHVTHWWSDHWNWSRQGDTFLVSGRLVPCRETTSSPLRHATLRLLSWTLGRRIIAGLKNRLIFRKADSPCFFVRRIAIEPHSMTLSDRIEHVPEGAEVVPAPRASKRHVASADGFHEEDLSLSRGVRVQRTTRFANGVFEAVTTCSFD